MKKKKNGQYYVCMKYIYTRLRICNIVEICVSRLSNCLVFVRDCRIILPQTDCILIVVLR